LENDIKILEVFHTEKSSVSKPSINEPVVQIPEYFSIKSSSES
jgi:hypothetical protein